jgi:phosphate transport system substrate-binding protein
VKKGRRMRLRIRPFVILLGAIAILLAAWPASAEALRIGGTGAVTEALRKLGPAFEAETGIALIVVPGLGTSGANNALADGKLGLVIAGRDLRDKEKERGLQVVGHLRTPFGFVTSRTGSDNLKSGEIAALYADINPTWPDGMPVLIVLRPVDESDNDVVAALFPGVGEAVVKARKRRDLSIAGSDQDNADMAEKMKGSLVAMSLAQLKAEDRNLRFVAVDGIVPSLNAYLDGSYRYGKLLYLVAPATPSAEAKVFVEFLNRPATRSRLHDLGLVAGDR